MGTAGRILGWDVDEGWEQSMAIGIHEIYAGWIYRTSVAWQQNHFAMLEWIKMYSIATQSIFD